MSCLSRTNPPWHPCKVDYCGMPDIQVSDKGMPYLQDLVQLKRLGLAGTTVTGASMPVVARLTCLQALDLALTGVDNQGEASGRVTQRRPTSEENPPPPPPIGASGVNRCCAGCIST